MANERNAGRKPVLNDEDLARVKDRIGKGESAASIAREYGISRQALSKRLKNFDKIHETCIDYYCGEELCSSVIYDSRSQLLRLINYTDKISKRAFGVNEHPDLEDLLDFLKKEYLIESGLTENDQYLLVDDNDIDVLEAFEDNKNGKKSNIRISRPGLIPKFVFTKNDRVIRRTDTDGYQMKAITKDRRYFVKAQAVISGVLMRDWAVEIVASDICEQLSIPCVIQRHCRFVYGGREYDGVYSDNFELDGYSFISFERLLEQRQKSSDDEEFIALNALDKLKWCAEELAISGHLDIIQTTRYMLDLCVIDCLVGNVDRHTRNFGLFYNVNTGNYEIPLIFDNGMGLFEHDYYRDRYTSYESAMNNVYVAPYGEDPFDMIKMLDEEYDLKKMYPGIGNVKYSDILSTPYALEYERRIAELWQK